MKKNVQKKKHRDNGAFPQNIHGLFGTWIILSIEISFSVFYV